MSETTVERHRLKHTPGPWTIDGTYLVGGDQYILAVIGHRNYKGNAPILTAAPDLLKALRVAEESLLQSKSLLLHAGYTGSTLDYPLQLAREAILKATKDEV